MCTTLSRRQEGSLVSPAQRKLASIPDGRAGSRCQRRLSRLRVGNQDSVAVVAVGRGVEQRNRAAFVLTVPTRRSTTTSTRTTSPRPLPDDRARPDSTSLPAGLSNAGDRTPEWPNTVIVYDKPLILLIRWRWSPSPPSWRGRWIPRKFRVRPGQLLNLPGFAAGRSGEVHARRFEAVQSAGTYTYDGKARHRPEDGGDSRQRQPFALQLNADAPQTQECS